MYNDIDEVSESRVPTGAKYGLASANKNEPSVQPRVIGALNRQDALIGQLSDTVIRLEARLESILEPQPEKTISGKEVDAPINISGVLERNNDNLDGIAAHIHHIINRLEI